ncbi:hypothetical protein [Thermomonospora echinospora]|nr:hypothetical protein [Thermomonospora echinospora]
MTINDRSLNLVRISRTVYIVYMKPDDTFWREVSGRKSVNKLSGKYLKATVDDMNLKELTAFMDYKGMLGKMLRSAGTVTKGTLAMINWNPAITLKDRVIGDVHVATIGRPYVLQIESRDDKEQLDFTGHGVPVNVTSPPPNMVTDIDVLRKLVGGTGHLPLGA